MGGGTLKGEALIRDNFKGITLSIMNGHNTAWHSDLPNLEQLTRLLRYRSQLFIFNSLNKILENINTTNTWIKKKKLLYM